MKLMVLKEGNAFSYFPNVGGERKLAFIPSCF